MPLTPNVHKMSTTFTGIFREAPALLPASTPHQRYLALRREVSREAGENGTLSLSLAALRSFAIAAASGEHKATLAGLDDPVAVTRRSYGLLDVADLDHHSENQLQEPPFSLPVNGLQTLNPDLLVVRPGEEDPELVAIDYVPHIRSRLDAAAEEPTGCPAPRLMLRNMYERYVDLIYPDEQ